MGVPSSGQLKLRGNGDGTGINEEVFGNVTATNVSLGALATEAGFDTPPDAMREFYGYVSAVVPSVTTNSATFSPFEIGAFTGPLYFIDTVKCLMSFLLIVK